MGRYKQDNVIIIANQHIPVDAPVVTWEQSGWNAISQFCIPTETEAVPACTMGAKGGQVPYGLPKGSTPYVTRYAQRPALYSYHRDNKIPPLSAVQAVIKMFVIHHDGCATSDMCWNVLQNERGLSCHFLVDNDGTIYQTIDLMWMAYHASEWNTNSIGVELCNRGDVTPDPKYYSKHGINRPQKPCKINGHTILSWDFTTQQYESMIRLGKALQKILPNLPAEYPQSSPGVQSWGTLPHAQTYNSYAGYIGHYHLWDQKWDPGPFDFKDFCRRIRGSFCFPVFPDPKLAAAGAQPTIPTTPSDLTSAAELLYKANEQRAEGGFFPVGPWGEQRLWHGGIHLTAPEKAPVFSPFPGRLVAARMGPSSAIGSTNFMLIRHDMTLGKSRVQFYSLYMHVALEDKGSDVGWVTSKAYVEAYQDTQDEKDAKTGEVTKKGHRAQKPGEVILLDEPIEAGALIGHVGKAGPGDLAKAQLHLEFFSNAELFTDVGGAFWTLIDGSAGGRFCDSPEINDLIDTDKNGLLSKSELSNFYSGGGGAGTRNFVTYHVSEWTAEPSWSEALRVPKDFKKVPPAEIDAMVAEQITPGLWWDDRVAQHCKLPVDGVVYHYHPVTFVAWFNQMILDAAATAGPGTIDLADAKEVPKGITDDFGDKDGTSMRSTGGETDDPCNTKLTLKELVLGFEAPECGP